MREVERLRDIPPRMPGREKRGFLARRESPFTNDGWHVDQYGQINEIRQFLAGRICAVKDDHRCRLSPDDRVAHRVRPVRALACGKIKRVPLRRSSSPKWLDRLTTQAP